MSRMLQRLFLLSLTLLLAACSPSLNWRQVRLKPEGGAAVAEAAGSGAGVLQALLPCKPDQAARRQSMAGYDVAMTMLGCEADGGLFTIAVAEPGSRQALAAVLAQWQTHLLAAVHAQGASRKPFLLKGADAQPEGTQLLARGRQDAATPPTTGERSGEALVVQAVWFVRGARLYHAAVYAKRLTQDMTDPFFSSLVLE